MKHFSGYGTYLLFLALKTHFTKPKYDFFKMQGKLRASKESYLKRNDKAFFEKLSRMYNAEELKNFFVANLLDDRHYITDMLDENAHGTYMEYEKRRQSLSYVFKNDMQIALDRGCRHAFHTTEHEYPALVNLLLRSVISYESAAILNDFVPFAYKFDKYLGDDDIVWSRVALKLRKIRPFIKYDAEKFKAILKEKVNENSTGRSI